MPIKSRENYNDSAIGKPYDVWKMNSSDDAVDLAPIVRTNGKCLLHI